MDRKIYWNRVVAIVVGLIMVSISVAFLCFQIVKVCKVVEAVKAREAFLVEADSMLNHTSLNRDELLKAEEELSFMQSIIPHSLDNASVLDYLDIVSIECNIEIISIAFEEDEDGDEYIQRPIHISIQGEYQYIMSFITQLRNGLRPFKVAEIKIERTDGYSELLYCELLLYAFIQRPPAE